MDIELQRKMDIRRRTIQRENIDRLLKLYDKKYKEGDTFGASKVAWILYKGYGVEGSEGYWLGAIN